MRTLKWKRPDIVHLVHIFSPSVHLTLYSFVFTYVVPNLFTIPGLNKLVATFSKMILFFKMDYPSGMISYFLLKLIVVPFSDRSLLIWRSPVLTKVFNLQMTTLAQSKEKRLQNKQMKQYRPWFMFLNHEMDPCTTILD